MSVSVNLIKILELRGLKALEVMSCYSFAK